jgi:integrase/recombinase XerD
MVRVLRSLVRGPLEPHVAGFAEVVLRQGYTRSSAERQACFIAHLDRWMQAADVGLGDLRGQVLELYLAARRAAGYRDFRSVKALRPLLDYLAPLGVVPFPPKVPQGPVEELLAGYRGCCTPAWTAA